MIQPIKNNSSVSFTSGMQDFQKQAKTYNMKVNNEPIEAKVDNFVPKNKEEKKSLKESFINILKGFNTIKGTTSGVIRGITDGITGACIVGVIGKNIKTQIPKGEKVLKYAESMDDKASADAIRNALNAGKEGAKELNKLLKKEFKGKFNDAPTVIKGILKDFGCAVVGVVKSIPGLLTKAPIENIKNGLNMPNKFFTEYLGKNNKATAAAAIITGASILAIRTIQGKMSANMQNADIDHATRTKH